MKEFMISEKYRLEIHWNKVKHTDDGRIKLLGCYLEGSVLREIEKLNDPDFMRLDFGNQYVVFVNNYHIVRFNWKDASYSPDKVEFKYAHIELKNPDVIPKLKDKDYIVVDTKQHDTNKMFVNKTETSKRKIVETKTMTLPLSYISYLLKEDGSLYSF